MDPKVLFWTGALIYMTVMVACAGIGWRDIRRGNTARHRRLMNLSAWMVVGFLVAYAVKVVALGKEDIFSWSQTDRWILWTHETIVAVMILAGGAARFIARRFDEKGRLPTGAQNSRARHIRAGRTAVISGLFAVLTAAMVLAGMYLRASAGP